MEDIYTWIKRRYRPVILIVSSMGAKSNCLRCNLTPQELFQPFCKVSQTFSVHTVNNTLNIPTCTLQIVENLEYERRDEVVSEINPAVNWEFVSASTRATADEFLQQNPTPWFEYWDEEFTRSQMFNSNDLIDMPLCIVYLASTTDPNPIGTLQSLVRPQSLPPQYQARVYDARVPKVFFVLHDPAETEMTNEEVVSLYQRGSKLFQPSLFLWQTLNTSSQQVNDSPWGLGKGMWIDPNERFQLQVFVTEMLTRAIVPYVEASFRELDNVITQKRRGFKNALKNFFKKSDRAENFNFQVGTFEHVTRYIADLAFLFNDFELALGHYRTVCEDFKQVRAWPHAAAASEMVAVCLVMMNGETRDIEYALDSAYSLYSKSGRPQLLTKAALLARRVYFHIRLPRKLSAKMLQISSDVKDIPVAYPLFIEQAAMAYLRFDPPYFRKFGFYLVLAGDEYRKMQLIRHAFYCYYTAFHIYNNKNWNHLLMHLLNMLGRFCYFMEYYLEAVHFFVELVHSPKLIQSDDKQQQKVLSELMATVSKWISLPIPPEDNPITKQVMSFHDDGKPQIVFGLPKLTHFEMRLPQDSVTETEVDNQVMSWCQLLEMVKGTFELKQEFMLYDGVQKKKVLRTCHQGELVITEITLLNPLQLLLIVENVQLIAKFEDGSTGDIIFNSVQKMDIPPKKSVTFEVGIIPNSTGILQILGVRWTYGGTFHGVHYFNDVKFQVLEHCPLISSSIKNFPQQSLDGQIQPFQLSLQNQGEMPIENIQILFSDPIMVGHDQIQLEILEAGEETILDMWVRPNLPGKRVLRILVLYKTNDKWKFCRLQSMIETQPSIKIIARYDPSLQNINQNLLQLNIQTLIPGELQVTQISTMSQHSIALIQQIRSNIFYMTMEEGDHNPDLVFSELATASNVREGFCSNILQQLPKNAGAKVIICWQISSQGNFASGVYFLNGLQLQSPENKLPLHMSIQAPKQIKHDFDGGSQGDLCVDVALYIKNIGKEPITFLIEALDSSTPIDEKETPKPPFFFWQGASSQLKKDLPVGDALRVDLKAHFSQPGCYNLNRFCFTLFKERPVKYFIYYQHYLLINQ